MTKPKLKGVPPMPRVLAAMSDDTLKPLLEAALKSENGEGVLISIGEIGDGVFTYGLAESDGSTKHFRRSFTEKDGEVVLGKDAKEIPQENVQIIKKVDRGIPTPRSLFETPTTEDRATIDRKIDEYLAGAPDELREVLKDGVDLWRRQHVPENPKL